MIENLLKAIIAIVIILITTVLLPYIKTKINNEKYAKLLIYIEYAVRYAEQMYTDEDNKIKKECVYNYILQKSNDLGLDLKEDDIDLLVEGVVNLIKHGGE